MTARSRFGWAAAASLASLAAFAGFLVLNSGTPVAERGSELVQGAAALVAAAACARAARRGGPDGRGWGWLSVAALVFAAGNAAWTVYGITRDYAYPFPSVADVGRLGFAVPAALGLLSFPREAQRLVSRFRPGLDAIAIAASILFVSWATVLGPLYRAPSQGLPSRLTGLAYPVVDITVASLVLALGMRRAAGARLPWVLLGGGLVTLAVSDSVYVHRTVDGVYAAGTILNVGWPLAFLLVALAALVPVSTADGGDGRRGRIQEFVPYLPFLGALAVAVGKRSRLADDAVLLWSGLVCIVAFGARQAMIVIENLALTDDLHAKVERRTAELAEANRRLTAGSESAALLRTVMLAANDASTVEAALQVAIDEVCRHTGWPVGHVCLIPEESVDEVVPTAIWHLADAGRVDGLRRRSDAQTFALGAGLPGRVAREAVPVWIEDVRTDAGFLRAASGDDLGVRAAFAVPMLAGDQMVGVLEFFSYEAAPADRALLELVAQLGAEIGRVVERKRAGSALRDSEGRTLAILAAATDAFVGMDDRGVVTDWNRSAEATFGWTREEALGRSLAATIVPEAHRQAHERGLARFLATGDGPVLGRRLELPALHRDGHEFPAELSIWRSGGRRPSFNAFVQDITHRKQNEVALGLARDQALDASRAKSEFLATMSHEIRTPMNGVIGLTGLLLGSNLSDAQRHHAEGVRASGEALLGIINDILDFSKIEAGELELETVDFDLGRAIEEVAELVAESARAKGLELVAYPRPEVPAALRGDVGRLRQILLNFATNAIKFTDAGEVVLRAVLAEGGDHQGVLVRFEVADTGPGVDPATAERLFEPFSQADASTTRRYGGTGLGLAICRRLAAAMGGTIGVDSGPGEGSTFWALLPLAHASDPLAAPARTGHWLAGRPALVVDDNDTNRLVLVAQLRAWGIVTDQAPDADQGLELLRQAAAASRPYDLALLDMAMPGMDGLELARIVTADPLLATVRLLLLSSISVEAEAAAEAGFVASLTKPVRLSSLYDALVRAVRPSLVDVGRPADSRPAAASVPRGTVLVVEDHTINQDVARGMVAKLGYGSDVAGDGFEALAALERRSYDAVLMDCYMPRMDGFQATAEIRRREGGRRHVPIIAMTAGGLVQDRDRCLAAGMDDYLLKPVDDRDLEAVLARWAGGADPTSPREQPAAGDGAVDGVQVDRLRRLAAATGDPGFLRSFVDQYLDQAATQLAHVRDASARADAPALKALAHGLKGTSATMGASRVASACAALEKGAARGEGAQGEGVERLAEELARATVALRRTADVPG